MNIHPSAWIAPGAAVVLGDVTIKEHASVWYHATVRGDAAPIVIGKGSNVQDNCVIHAEKDYPVTIGENVTIGHGAIIHGCEIGDGCLIGMGAILLNGCVIGRNSIIGAGSLVTQGTRIPEGTVALGSPAKVKRAATPEEIHASIQNARNYAEEASRK